MKFQKSTVPPRYPALGVALFVSLTGVLSASSVRGANKKTAPRTGEQVYQQLCASCHGAKGEGTAKYQKPLAGARSAGELAGFIAKSMPPGPKRLCVGEDARGVARYIYDAFYSPVAQARNKPARVELSHLTVREYRNAVADLIGSFRPVVKWDQQRGLHAEYFRSRRFQNNERVIDRVDPQVHFDWAQSTPDGDKFEPHTFSGRWQGSVVATDTGDYDFVIKTDHAFRLWVNDPKKALIDAWVKSGKDTEFHGSVYLMAGRAYPVRLEFTKATSGVDDTAKLKDKPIEKAFLSFDWKPPHRATEVIPQRCLLPNSTPESFALETPFPPDDRSLGYERGTAVSKEWDDATTEGALGTAQYVIDHLRDFTGPENAADRANRVREFCKQFTTRAFRRPLTPDQEQFYIDRQLKGAPDVETGVKRVILLALKSPRFLYREIGSQKPDAFDVASRLSFGLWDSLPDTELLRAAGAGELSTREQVMRQAERMVADPRTRSKIHDFFMLWLKVDQYPDLAKDAKRFPGFDAAAASDLRTSLELTLDQLVWSDKSDFRELMQSNQIYLNGRLAKIYGVNLPEDAPFQPVTLDGSERAGILTHPYVLSSFAYVDNSSPIHRGVLIARNVLGRLLQPPPQAFAPLAAALHPDLTTRQRVTLQTKPDACIGCHGMINPLGFTLEKFDAIGRLRTDENGHPIDCTGSYQSRGGKLVKFGGAKDLATFLATSDETHGAFVEKLFQYVVKQPVRAYGPQALPDLEKAFAANEFNIRKQLVESMAVAALAPASPRQDTALQPAEPRRIAAHKPGNRD